MKKTYPGNTSLLLIIWLITFTFSCKDLRTDLSRSEFKQSLTISRTDLDSILIPPVLFHERKIIATANHLISINIDSDTIYRVFRLHDFEYMGGFGKHGQGPSEFLMPNISGLKPDQSGVLLSDLKSVNLVTHGTLINNTNIDIHLDQTFNIPAELMPLNYPFILNDSTICGANRKIMELTCFNCNNSDVEYLIPLPDIYPNASSAINSVLYINHVAISPNKSSIAFLYSRFPMLRIYDVNSGSIIQTDITEGPEQINFRFNDRGLTNGTDSYNYYNNIVVTDKHIYGDFQAREREATDNGIESIPLSNRQIHVFDWQGEPKLKIDLNEDWFNVFTVSHDDKYVYFLHPSIENRVYRYELPYSY